MSIRSAKDGLKIRAEKAEARCAEAVRISEQAKESYLSLYEACFRLADQVTETANFLHGTRPSTEQMDEFRSPQWRRQLVEGGRLTMDALWTVSATFTRVTDDVVSLARIGSRGEIIVFHIPLRQFDKWFRHIVLRATVGTFLDAHVEVPFRATIHVEGTQMWVELPALAGAETISVRKGDMADLLIQKLAIGCVNI
jgi:hypothetical protein